MNITQQRNNLANSHTKSITKAEQNYKKSLFSPIGGERGSLKSLTVIGTSVFPVLVSPDNADFFEFFSFNICHPADIGVA